MDFSSAFAGKKVLVTGHTGFKGSWLSLWLQKLQADLMGFSLPEHDSRSNFACSHVAEGMRDLRGDIRDFDAVMQLMRAYQPSIVFHLAAQPLVLHSFEQPKYTFDVNVGGTLNILEAVRRSSCVEALILVTSDKCYHNREWIWGYRENDLLGGDDPYSASKSMAEQAIASYRHAFFKEGIAVASVRAGNVIGGGDFSACRLMPDCIQALSTNQPICLRQPKSVRTWLYHLDCLSGYLQLAAHHLSSQSSETLSGLWEHVWNFGSSDAIDVQTIVEKSIEQWGAGDWIHEPGEPGKEKQTLRLNWEKAARLLNWSPLYTWEEAVQKTVLWHKQSQQDPMGMRPYCLEQIQEHMQREQERCNSHCCL